jgi:hypothetical protein
MSLQLDPPHSAPAELAPALAVTLAVLVVYRPAHPRDDAAAAAGAGGGRGARRGRDGGRR